MILLITFIKTTPLEVVLSLAITPLNETLEILTKVNEFYDSAWSKLMFLLSGIVAVFGVLLPYLIQYYQKKNLKAVEKELENKLIAEIEKAKTDIEQKIVSDIENKLIENENNLKKIVFEFKGRTMHLQGNSSFAKTDYFGALKDFCYSASHYSKAFETSNLGVVLSSIKKTLVHINKEQLDQLKNIDSIDLKKILEEIEKNQGDNFEILAIRAIRQKIYDLDKQ